MKTLIAQIIVIFLMYFNASAQNSDIKRYHDKFVLAKDLFISFKNKDIDKLHEISEKLVLPYSLYKSIKTDLYKDIEKVDIGQIRTNSILDNDSVLYKKYAGSYFLQLLSANLFRDNHLTLNTGNVFIATYKQDQVINNHVSQNILLVCFESENELLVLCTESILKIDGVIYNSRQIYPFIYDKKNIPSFYHEKLPDEYEVYRLNKDTLTLVKNNIFQFNTIWPNAFNNETNSIDNAADKSVTKDEKIKQEEDVIQIQDFKTSEISPAELSSFSASDVLDRAEIMPSFQNGAKGLAKFLKENLKYPKTAVKNKIEGKVWVKFIVEKDGSIRNPVVLKTTVGSECTDEALRLVNKMPKWWPGKQNGKTARVYYILPITFSLKD